MDTSKPATSKKVAQMIFYLVNWMVEGRFVQIAFCCGKQRNPQVECMWHMGRDFLLQSAIRSQINLIIRSSSLCVMLDASHLICGNATTDLVVWTPTLVSNAVLYRKQVHVYTISTVPPARRTEERWLITIRAAELSISTTVQCVWLYSVFSTTLLDRYYHNRIMSFQSGICELSRIGGIQTIEEKNPL